MKNPNVRKPEKLTPMTKTKTRRMTIDRLALIIQQEFLNVYDRLNEMENHLGRIDNRLDRIEERLDRVEERLDRMEKRLDEIDERLCIVERKMGELNMRQSDMRADYSRFADRVIILEQKVGV